MLLSEINRMRMIKAVLAYLKNSPAAILLLLPILTTLTSAMEALVNAMISAEQTQGTVAIGAGSTKAEKRIALFNTASSVGKALLSYANSAGNNDLAVLMTEMLKRMDDQADSTFVMRCRTIAEKGAEYIGSMAPYGISDAVIEVLNASIEEYSGQEASVRNRIVSRANATTAIATLQREITALLKKQIDPAVETLPNNDETIAYKFEYKRNRVILNIGHKYTQFKGVVINKETQTALSNVVLEFRTADRSVTIKSDTGGKYKERLNPDIWDIVATHPDFEPFVIEGVKIQAGEIKVENIEMVPKA